MKAHRLLFRLVLICLLIHIVAAPARCDEPAAPDFKPGKEVRLDLPNIGGGYCLVYVPSNYNPDHPTPIIFCHHGLNGKPTTWPFRQNTGGRDFIIVGMEYFVRELQSLSTAQWHERGVKEGESCKTVYAYLGKYLNINSRAVIVGGFSQGGFHSVTIYEENPDFFTAAAIGGAGRELGTGAMSHAAAMQGKPFYIGVGENGPNNGTARKLLDFYRTNKLQVTFEEFPGLKHEMKADSSVLHKFLLDNGPLRDYDALMSQADAAKRARQLGKALVAYQQAAALLPDHDRTAPARDVAKALLAEAETQFTTVQQAIEAKQFTAALRMLADLHRTYSGSSVAERAQGWIDKFSNDPELREQIAAAKLNQKAEELKTRAEKAEAAGDYAAALKVYETYVDQCAGAGGYDEVKLHYEKLKNDPKVTAKASNQDAAKECEEWLAMARNLIKAGRKRLARPYLNKVIDNYPQTEYAVEAKKMLDGK